MKCLNCKKNITIKRNILNLFSLKKEYICNECFANINFVPNEIILPVNNYLIKIYYLLLETENFKYESLINEYSTIYNYLKNTNNILLVFNRYYMSDKNYEFLEHLANHHKTNINILVYELFD